MTPSYAIIIITAGKKVNFSLRKWVLGLNIFPLELSQNQFVAAATNQPLRISMKVVIIADDALIV